MSRGKRWVDNRIWKSTQKRMSRNWSIIENQLGNSAESYFDEVLKDAQARGKLPPWIVSWERHEKWSPHDRRGVDFTIKTDRGKIEVNIKSSQIFAHQFEKRHQNDGIIALVVNISLPKERVFNTVFPKIGHEYGALRRADGKR